MHPIRLILPARPAATSLTRGKVLLTAGALAVFGAVLVYSRLVDPPAKTVTARPAAAVAGGEAAAPATSDLDLGSAMLDIGLKLALVVALAYGSLALLRRYTQAGQARRGRRLHVLESRALGANRTLYLVRAQDRELLLGVTAGQITTLAGWPAATELDAAPVAVAGGAAGEGQKKTFAALLGHPARRLGRLSAAAAAAHPPAPRGASSRRSGRRGRRLSAPGLRRPGRAERSHRS